MIAELGAVLPFDVAVDDSRRVAGARLNWPQTKREYRTCLYLRFSGLGAVALAGYQLLAPLLYVALSGPTPPTVLLALIYLICVHPWSPGSVRIASVITKRQGLQAPPRSVWRFQPSGPTLFPAVGKHSLSWTDVRSYAVQGDVLVLCCGKVGYGLTTVEGGLTMGELVDVVYRATGREPQQLNGFLYRIAYGVALLRR